MALAQDTSSLASLPVPSFDPPPGEVFTSKQWAILFSILEVILPTITPTPSIDKPLVSQSEFDKAVATINRFLPDDSPPNLAQTYLNESPTLDPSYRAMVTRRFALYISPSDTQGLGIFLSALNTRVGSLLLTGYTSPISVQPLSVRTSIVRSWASARLPPLRAIFRSLSGLAKQVWTLSSTTLPTVLGFPHIPKHIQRNDSHAYAFVDFASSSSATTISTDTVIVGSGCGAGVLASTLARAGFNVLVVEKCYHFSAAHFPMTSADAGEHLYENGGAVMSDDGSTAVLAGSTFGGGGTVNWSASLQPSAAVRREWANNNLPHFVGQEYQDCLDSVCRRMGVASSTSPEELGRIEHNHANQILLEGSRRLGMAVQTVPQNTAGKKHHCGYCTYGCASTIKQGPANCWFPDAAAHGAKFVEGAWVEKVLFAPGTKKATGVQAIWTSPDRKVSKTITINAKRVVVSAGTLHSPLLLTRSGINNPHIGRHLHLHPTAMIVGTFVHRTDPWDGAILTVVNTELSDLDGHHHGAKIEVSCSAPGIGLMSYAWRPSHSLSHGPENTGKSALEYRVNVAKHAHAAAFVCIARDADTGRVYADPKDERRVRISYTASKRDARSVLEAQIAAARVQFVMGAVEIDTGNTHAPRWVRPSWASSDQFADKSNEEVDDADTDSFKEYIAKVRDVGISTPDPVLLGSAHQMGTCRMSGYAADGVVDCAGKVWGTEGLYVADTSVFPSASGVNPMVSTMGISEWIARGIVRAEKGEVDFARSRLQAEYGIL